MDLMNLIANLTLCALGLMFASHLYRAEQRELALQGGGTPLEHEDEDATTTTTDQNDEIEHVDHVHCSGCGSYVAREELDAHECSVRLLQQ